MTRKRLHWLLLAWACVGVAGCSNRQESVPKYQYGDSAKTDAEAGGPAKKRANPPEEEFKKLDRDGNGSLTQEEFVGNVGKRKNSKLLRTRTELFAFLDQNHDGKLSLQEFKKRQSRDAQFIRLDVDGNGTLDLKELYAGSMPSASPERAKQIFDRMDENHDRKLTKEEFVKGIPTEFLKLDRNEDGFLSAEEFAPVGNQALLDNKHVKEAFALADENHDGRVSAEEFAAFAKSKEFAFYKKDKDGKRKLTLEQFSAGWDNKEAAKNTFEKKDLDHDGLLTLEEFKIPDEPAAKGAKASGVTREEEFKKLDTNGDHVLSRTEFIGNRRQPAEIHKAEQLFAIRDRDHDGKLTLQEFTVNRPETQFFQLDKDGDGRLTREEFSHFSNQVLVQNKHAEEALAAADQNHDGLLSFEEFQAFLQSRELSFYRQDKDGDGKLTFEEFSSEWATTPEALTAAQVIFARKDLDRGGSLTLAEFKASDEPVSAEALSTDTSPKAEFKRLDRNGDNALTLEEFIGDHHKPFEIRQRVELFAERDRNHDGKLTFQEFSKMIPERQFAVLDTNKDGFLSPEEFGQLSNQVLVHNKHAEEAFAFADQNHDGRLSPEEFAAFLDSKELLFYRKDKDGDGKLTFEEYTSDWENTPTAQAAAKTTFEQKDLDHDGRLTLEEFKVVVDQPDAKAPEFQRAP